MIDPYIDESRYKLLSSDDIVAADYIFISHSHFDHVSQLKKLSEKFDSQIFSGALSGIEMAKFYDIPGYRMNLCIGGDVIDTGDFVIQCFRGKHTNLGVGDVPSRLERRKKESNFQNESQAVNLVGSYEYMNYQLTLPSNLKILIWGGGATEAAIYQASQFEPDITIAQIPREDVNDVVRLYSRIGGRVIFPHHHEFFLEKGEEGERVISQIREGLKCTAPDTLFITPEKGKWYSVYTSVSVE